MKAGLREAVIDRDAYMVWLVTAKDVTKGFLSFERWRATAVVCVVPVLDPTNPIKCGGRQEVDHVKDQLGLSMKAPDDEFHLVAMCQEHNTWHPPRKELRQAERRYLSAFKDQAYARIADSEERD